MLIWGSREGNCFCRRDWTGQIALKWLGKLVFTSKVSGMDEAVRRLSSLSQPSWPLVLLFLGHAYVHGYPPFISRSVQTSEKAIKERLVVPSTYQGIGVDESRRTITFDEFFHRPDASRI